MDNVIGTIVLLLFVVAYTVLITFSITRDNQREFACVGLGYEGYRQRPMGCYVGTDPIMVYPYDTVFDRIE